MTGRPEGAVGDRQRSGRGPIRPLTAPGGVSVAEELIPAHRSRARAAAAALLEEVPAQGLELLAGLGFEAALAEAEQPAVVGGAGVEDSRGLRLGAANPPLTAMMVAVRAAMHRRAAALAGVVETGLVLGRPGVSTAVTGFHRSRRKRSRVARLLPRCRRREYEGRPRPGRDLDHRHTGDTNIIGLWWPALIRLRTQEAPHPVPEGHRHQTTRARRPPGPSCSTCRARGQQSSVAGRAGPATPLTSAPDSWR